MIEGFSNLTPDPAFNPSDGACGQIRLAYVILAHSDPVLFGRLMHRLDDPHAAAFVHLDGKAELAPFREQVADLPNVHFVDNRIRARWAGYSLVEATLRGFEAALAGTDEACTHFVLLSGSDYPIASNGEIMDFFRRHPDRQFIRRFAIMESGDSHQIWRIKGRFLREAADRFTWKRKPLFVIERMLRLIPRRFPKDIRFALGSQWIALTRECAAYCVERMRSDAPLTQFFRPTFAPDEIVFHTLVENSRFADQASPIEPYVDITKIGGPFAYGNVHALTPNVPIRTVDEAKAILAGRGERLFTRKLSSDQSRAALDVFDEAARHG